MTPHHAFPDVAWADLRAELLREIAHRQNTFPRLVSRGQLTQADADRQLDLFGALLEDVRRFQASREPVDQGKAHVEREEEGYEQERRDQQAKRDAHEVAAKFQGLCPDCRDPTCSEVEFGCIPF